MPKFSFSEKDYIRFFDDFFNFVAAQWIITTTEAGAGSATEAVSAGAVGGLLVVTNDAADDDADFFQWSGDDLATSAEFFKFVSGKRLYFAIRCKISDATQADFVAGLQITDTTPLAVSDGIQFTKADGSTALGFSVTKDAASSSLAGIHTVVADTFMVLEFYYDGGSTIKAYVDGVGVGSVAITNAPDDEDLTVSFGIQNGEAVAKVLTIDYIEVVAER